MALPTKADIQSMDFSLMGEVFVSLPSNSSIDTNGMDFSKMGEVFWTIPEQNPANFAKFGGVAWSSIAKINGIAKASVSKINGLNV